MGKRDIQQHKEESSGRFNFLGVAKYITIASILLTLVAAVIIAVKGFNYGVDFAGGTQVEVQFGQPVTALRVRKFTSDMGYKNATVQAYGGTNSYLIHISGVEGKTHEETNELLKQSIAKLKDGLGKDFQKVGAEIRQVTTIGPEVGSELRRNGILSGFYCMLLILIYVGLRFDYKYAPGAIFCVIHDAVITLGVYSLFNWEVTTQTMAAILTIVGYSMNDTLVIFDRIRENEGLERGKSIQWIANLSINETLSRTILTYLLTFLSVFAMFFLTDGVIKEFARAMLVGMTLGIYSTVYVATPFMLWLDRYQRKQG